MQKSLKVEFILELTASAGLSVSPIFELCYENVIPTILSSSFLHTFVHVNEYSRSVTVSKISAVEDFSHEHLST